MKKTKTTYPLNQSPLFKLSNRKKLCKLLHIELSALKKLQDNCYYNIFISSRNGKKRQIEEPTGIRRYVHDCLQNLLTRIEKPAYLFSKKGSSAIDNAKFHKNFNYFLITDISNFYKSAKREYIFRFFYYQMKTSVDIAAILADIICYENHIPTGSPLSQTIAFLAYSKIFNKIFTFAESNNVNFSLYVDDLTFSSSKSIPTNFLLLIDQIFNSVELKLKFQKTKYRSKNQYKLITGVAISPQNDLKIPNRHLKKIKEKKDSIKNLNSIDSHSLNSLLGSLRYARQIEPNSHDQLYKFLNQKEKN